MAYLDKTGLTYFWGKIKAQLGNKSDKGHTHSAGEVSGLAKVATTNSYNDLNNKPTIPTIPSSLPANGGNADTVDGWHFEVIGDGSSPSTVNTISFDYTEG